MASLTLLLNHDEPDANRLDFDSGSFAALQPNKQPHKRSGSCRIKMHKELD